MASLDSSPVSAVHGASSPELSNAQRTPPQATTPWKAMIVQRKPSSTTKDAVDVSPGPSELSASTPDTREASNSREARETTAEPRQKERINFTPSKVLHVRNLPFENLTKEELLAELVNLGSLAGPVVKVVVFNESQALIQMEGVGHAKALLDRFQVTPATLRGKRIRLQYSLQHEVVSTGNQKNVYVNPYSNGTQQSGQQSGGTLPQSHTPPAMTMSTILNPGQQASTGGNTLHVSSSSPSLLMSAFQPRTVGGSHGGAPGHLGGGLHASNSSNQIASLPPSHNGAIGQGYGAPGNSSMTGSMSTPSLPSLLHQQGHGNRTTPGRRSRSPSEQRKLNGHGHVHPSFAFGVTRMQTPSQSNNSSSQSSPTHQPSSHSQSPTISPNLSPSLSPALVPSLPLPLSATGGHHHHGNHGPIGAKSMSMQQQQQQQQLHGQLATIPASPPLPEQQSQSQSQQSGSPSLHHMSGGGLQQQVSHIHHHPHAAPHSKHSPAGVLGLNGPTPSPGPGPNSNTSVSVSVRPGMVPIHPSHQHTQLTQPHAPYPSSRAPQQQQQQQQYGHAGSLLGHMQQVGQHVQNQGQGGNTSPFFAPGSGKAPLPVEIKQQQQLSDSTDSLSSQQSHADVASDDAQRVIGLLERENHELKRPRWERVRWEVAQLIQAAQGPNEPDQTMQLGRLTDMQVTELLNSLQKAVTYVGLEQDKRKCCKLCGINEAVVVFLPCKHMVLCTKCQSAERLQQCPVQICRQEIKDAFVPALS